jgi:hypothetical protein
VADAPVVEVACHHPGGSVSLKIETPSMRFYLHGTPVALAAWATEVAHAANALADAAALDGVEVPY